jgi:hypothetical protein
MLPYIHEFSYGDIGEYATDDEARNVFKMSSIGNTAKQVAAAGAVGAAGLSLAPLLAPTAGAVGVAAGAAGAVGVAAAGAVAAAGPVLAPVAGAAGGIILGKAGKELIKGLDRWDRTNSVEAPLRKKIRGRARKVWSGGSKYGRGLTYENLSKFREDGAFVGTQFIGNIPNTNTVTIDTDFYRYTKQSDPVLQNYRFTFFGLLLDYDIYKRNQVKVGKFKELKPGRGRYGRMFSDSRDLKLKSASIDIKLVKAIPATSGQPPDISEENQRVTKKRDKLYDMMEIIQEFIQGREVSLRNLATHFARQRFDLDGQQKTYKEQRRCIGATESR